MKICYLNHDIRNNTGAGRFYNSFSSAIKKAIPGIGIEVLTSEDILYPNKLKLLLALPVIRKILRRCDIIHALDGWPYGVIAAITLIGLRKRKRDINIRTSDVQNIDGNSGTSDVPRLIITAIGTGGVKPLYSFWKRPIMKWAYRKADKVIAVGNNTKKEILKIMPDLKIEVINHGVDFTKFTSMAGTSDNHRSSDVQKLKPYILSVGTLKKRKGFDYSIEAFAKVAEKFKDLKYVIVGDGPEYNNLKFKIENLKLGDRVAFLSDLLEEKLIALYKNAELFILLPQDVGKDIEGFGLVFLEAAAAGLPLVATKETSAEDAVRNGQNGILVPPRDYQAAAAAVSKILSDSALRKRMSTGSLVFAKSMSWKKVAEQYKALYNG